MYAADTRSSGARSVDGRVGGRAEELGEGTIFRLGGLLTSAAGPLTADDVVKARWTITNDAASATTLDYGPATLVMFEITQ